MALTAAQLRRLKGTTANGNRVREARKLAGLTQQQLADELGFTQTGLSDLERQRYGSTTVETARKFAEFFGCAIEDLFPAKQEVA